MLLLLLLTLFHGEVHCDGSSPEVCTISDYPAKVLLHCSDGPPFDNASPIGDRGETEDTMPPAVY